MLKVNDVYRIVAELMMLDAHFSISVNETANVKYLFVYIEVSGEQMLCTRDTEYEQAKEKLISWKNQNQ